MPVTAYVAPLFLYVGLTALAGVFPESYAWTYPGATLLAGIGAYLLLRGRNILIPHLRIWPAVAVGVVGTGLWLVLSTPHLVSLLADVLPGWLSPRERVGFNPFEEIPGGLPRSLFLASRFAGLVLVVPVAEEIFWRGFLIRFLVDRDWERVPLGTFTWVSFSGVVVLFSLVHPEMAAAAVYAVLLNLLFYRTRDLWSCVVAHAVTNLLLAVYVPLTGNWQLW